jgi:Flp pilus assembly protein TadG
MKLRISNWKKRRGAVAPMAALLMTLLVGMLAFSIDIGYICAVEAELQNAADAAALAGAQQMQLPFVQFYSPGQTNQVGIYNYVTTNTTDPNSPISTAQRFASYNKAGGVYVQVPTSDISFSYYDGTNPFVAASYPNYFPNTITVTTRRDNTANSPLGLFFSTIFGMNSTTLTATASATIYAGDVTSLQVISGVNAHILPVALDVNIWINYSNGNFAPLVTNTSPWLVGSVTTGPNGNPQLQVYPSGTNTPGSFGLLDVGVPSNSTPAFRNWIDDGTTPNDISYLLTHNLLPVSMTAPEPWKVGPGLTSTLLSNFQQQMNQPNLIPLFTPVSQPPNYVAASGTGQNATYAIVGFAGINITQAESNGSNMIIAIQPYPVVDPTAVIMNASPARASQLTQFGTSQTTFVSAKLTQ